MATTRHRSLVERGGRKALLEPCKHKNKCQKKTIFTILKKRFEHIELPAKLLDYFLRSNTSNINFFNPCDMILFEGRTLGFCSCTKELKGEIFSTHVYTMLKIMNLCVFSMILRL